MRSAGQSGRKNLDPHRVAGLAHRSPADLDELLTQYLSQFPGGLLRENGVGFDAVRGGDPFRPPYVASQVIAGSDCWRLACAAALGEHLGMDASHAPLHSCRDRTRLERRMTRGAGRERIAFRDAAPYWCVLGFNAGTRG